jgi:hypothetical protein
MLSSLAGNAATRATEAIEDELADVSSLSPDKREARVEQIAGRYAAAIQLELPVLAGELADWLGGMEAASLGMYEAALADDPDHRIAWYRIAMHSSSSESLRRLALLRLRQLDPDNAMPWYLEAGRHGTNRLEEALEALEEGNRKPWWKYPEPDYPADFNLRFPDLEPYAEAGVAGEPVPAWVIQSYGDANTMLESIGWSSRKTGLVAGLSECGDQLIQAGETEKGMRCLIAARELCLKIAGNRNLDTMWGISGLSIIRAPDGILTELPPDTLSAERETILRRTADVRAGFQARLSALLSEVPPVEGVDLYRNLEANRAYEARHQGPMEELLEDPQFRRCSFLPEF